MSDSNQVFSWGVAGTGQVAIDFATQIANSSAASIGGVYSRDLTNAERFQATFNATCTYESFELMLNDDDLDAVYIAVPPGLHKQYCIMALRAKKPVLCEKPFALDAQQTDEILAVSREEGVFCMEAMWMRFSPIVQQLRSRIVNAELGDIRNITIQAGTATHMSRLVDADPGRGALLNFGVYGVSLVQMLLGNPDTVHADFLTLENGLDESCVLTLKYPECLVTIANSIRLPMSNEAVITGTKGRARIGGPFFSPGFAQLSWHKEPAETEFKKPVPSNALPIIDKVPFSGIAKGAFWATLLKRRGKLLVRDRGGDGLKLEAAEVMRCVRNSQIESEVMPHRDTLSVARILDEARLSKVSS